MWSFPDRVTGIRLNLRSRFSRFTCLPRPPRTARLRLLRIRQLDLEDVDLLDLPVQNAGKFHFLPLETMHQVGTIKAEDIRAVRARRQNQIAPQMLNAVNGTSIRGPAHGL